MSKTEYHIKSCRNQKRGKMQNLLTEVHEKMVGEKLRGFFFAHLCQSTEVISVTP